MSRRRRASLTMTELSWATSILTGAEVLCEFVSERFHSYRPGSTDDSMKIESITLREVHMPLVHFFETSFGRIYSRRILLVSVQCDGLIGWGECVAGEDPFYSSEWIDSAWPTLTRYLAPALLGREFDSAREWVGLFAK